LRLFSLERRKLTGDSIAIFKIMKGLDRVDREKLFLVVKGSRMRGYRFKVIAKEANVM